ncbi:glycine--tRNA ligase subunit beta [Candidatus Endomicrobiellum trichonymphae]|uniref:Glycine--tRNA ligase beta subunit n=1 Tax=Endomicrobium trichonymphae TaxID=1408204 RepID=B1GZQ1_ENDTX|nr:glycine--tRNA ligase subunit beta [Candidatus Endomicrobium trichonymphae]BAG13733.1 glycyl-tRNA synthetase beta subunit [Candidatus Endomicrobium trichonymphae]
MVDGNIKNALLEIGAEEIPSSYIEPALKQIEDYALKAFNTSGLKHGVLKTYATPRRLVLIVENLEEKSDDKTEEVLGPSLNAAKDAHGKYTRAAVGFALKNGVIPEKLAVKTTEKGDYLFFVKKIKGEKTEKLLVAIFPEIIKNISFPKIMIWEESGFKFARPVRNIVALYGKKVIKFKIADVNSSNWTVGLHTYDNSRIKIDLPEKYLLAMKNKSVIVDQNERREEIKRSIKYAAENIGSVIPDEELVDKVNYLVEYPSAVLCAFNRKYLDLPQEILTVCMRKSQKSFAINDENGKFSNYFISVKNGVSKYQETAKEGYEKVVAARLADAEFFYSNDLKKGLGINIEKLKGIVFHKEIGTVYEKIERIKQIATLFNEEFDMRIDGSALERAVMLSKVDLTSEMVFEYPELQGVMGRIYALKSGENADVASSVEQHYWPLVTSGKLPLHPMASLLSLADKIDTLTAFFSIGLEPSGSADPYGVKRAGTGFVKVAMNELPKCDLTGVVGRVFEFLPENVKNNPKSKDACERLIKFFWQRIENIFESEGYNSDEVKAVINAVGINKLKYIGSLRTKLEALRNADREGDFSFVVAIFKRINNIISQAKKQNIGISGVVNEDLLAENAEKALYTAAKKAKAEIENCVSANEYGRVFGKVSEIKPAIDSFFEKVMVMAEDETIKLNRVSLLSYIKNMFAGFVDFSVLRR